MSLGKDDSNLNSTNRIIALKVGQEINFITFISYRKMYRVYKFKIENQTFEEETKGLEKLISKLFDWLDFGLNQTSDHSLINIKDIYELIIDLKDIDFENNDTRKIVELLKKFDNSLE